MDRLHLVILPSVSEYLGYLYILTIMNSGTMNIDLQNISKTPLSMAYSQK